MWDYDSKKQEWFCVDDPTKRVHDSETGIVISDSALNKIWEDKNAQSHNS